jgi:hypothetical protein
MRFPDRQSLGFVKIEGVGEFEVVMHRVDAALAAAPQFDVEALRAGIEELDDPWPVPGAREDDPRDDWCRKRDVLALLDSILTEQDR